MSKYAIENADISPRVKKSLRQHCGVQPGTDLRTVVLTPEQREQLGSHAWLLDKWQASNPPPRQLKSAREPAHRSRLRLAISVSPELHRAVTETYAARGVEISTRVRELIARDIGQPGLLATINPEGRPRRAE